MKLSTPSVALLGLTAALLSVSSASAQVNYTETFDVDLAGWTVTGGWAPGSGWAGAGFRFPIGGADGCPVINIYSGATTGEITSPLVGTATGSLITFSFDTKKNNFNAATGETDLPHGTIEAFYGPTATGPWTSIVAVTDQVETGTAYNVTGSFTPPSGDVYIQFQCSHAGGDWDGYVDNLSVVETGGNPPATHSNYGTGCYNIATATQAVYQNFPDAATAVPALLGTSITFTPTANGYTLTNGGGTYVAPTGAATLIPLGDDDSAPFTPSVPFPHVGGAVTDLEVHSNCFVSMGPGNANNVYGSVPALLGSAVASFRANYDLDPSVGGSLISAEEVGNVLHITWEAPRWNFTAIERVQMQFDLVAGTVVMVWQDLPTLTSTGDTVVGYAPGVSNDPGVIDLAVDLPITTEPDLAISAISLSASPAPVSTSTTGTTVMYQIDNIPDANVSSGIYFGALVISFTGDIAGTDLGFIDMPGCNLHVGALDVLIAYNGATSSQMVPLNIPANVAVGTQLWAQAAALVVPGSLPNGENAFGAVTSNGVESFISDN